MLVETILVLIGLFLYWFVKDQSKYNGYPPGPFRFPLLGTLPQFLFKSPIPSTALRQFSDKYGDVMFVKMGTIDFVVISSYSAVMELFSLEGVSSNRKVFKFIEDRSLGGNVGIVTSNGPAWHNVRRFTIRTLREFGFGKSASMDTVINEEAGKFLIHFENRMKGSEDGILLIEHHLFDAAVLNVLWRLVTGKSYELDDERVLKTLKLSDEYLRSIRVEDITVCYPALRDWFPEWSGRNLQHRCVENLKAFLKEVVKEHEEGDYMENPQCFIDVFLQMIQKESSLESSDFNHNMLAYTLLDLFQAGSETTSKTLNFVLIYMVLYPDKQERVIKEIDAALKVGRMITSDMKSKLPYTSAVILETTRIIDVVPIPGPFEPDRDLNFRGYRIAKGTPIMTNLEAVHYQKSIWGDPDTFRPERFINSESGAIEPKLLEYVMPFSRGKRICLGQALAETTLLLFFVNLMKNFKFEKVEGDPGPNPEPKAGLTYTSRPFKVQVSIRAQN